MRALNQRGKMASKRTAREGRNGSTYPPVHTGHSEAQPNQRIPEIKGSGNTRKEYDACQGPRDHESEPASSRKPGQ